MLARALVYTPPHLEGYLFSFLLHVGAIYPSPVPCVSPIELLSIAMLSTLLFSVGRIPTCRVGIALAIGSGVLIGSSFVFKKKGLLASQGENLGEGVAYLKNVRSVLASFLQQVGSFFVF